MNPAGLIFMYMGFGTSMAIVMFHGFIKNIPEELEEAATIDGCNSIQLFFIVVVPLMRTILITEAVLNVMWIWNDYLLPSLIARYKERFPYVEVDVMESGEGHLEEMLLNGVIDLVIENSSFPEALFERQLFQQEHIILAVQENSPALQNGSGIFVCSVLLTRVYSAVGESPPAALMYTHVAQV